MNAGDTTLNAVALKHLMWKPSTMRNLARQIVERVLCEPHTLWPDELKHDGLSEHDRHCVGTCYRLLMMAGIIVQTGSYRRSTSPSRNAGAVFEYRLVCTHRARLFLERNPVVIIGQQNLFRE
jgi:hypothetical protein